MVLSEFSKGHFVKENMGIILLEELLGILKAGKISPFLSSVPAVNKCLMVCLVY